MSDFFSNVWNNVAGAFWDPGRDELGLIDSENGQCYARRRTAESRREFQNDLRNATYISRQLPVRRASSSTYYQSGSSTLRRRNPQCLTADKPPPISSNCNLSSPSSGGNSIPPPPISTVPAGHYRLNQAKPGRPTSYPVLPNPHLQCFTADKPPPISSCNLSSPNFGGNSIPPPPISTSPVCLYTPGQSQPQCLTADKPPPISSCNLSSPNFGGNSIPPPLYSTSPVGLYTPGQPQPQCLTADKPPPISNCNLSSPNFGGNSIPPPPISTVPVGHYRLNQAKPGKPTSYPVPRSPQPQCLTADKPPPISSCNLSSPNFGGNSIPPPLYSTSPVGLYTPGQLQPQCLTADKPPPISNCNLSSPNFGGNSIPPPPISTSTVGQYRLNQAKPGRLTSYPVPRSPQPKCLTADKPPPISNCNLSSPNFGGNSIPPPPISTVPVGHYRLNQAKPGKPTSYPVPRSPQPRCLTADKPPPISNCNLSSPNFGGNSIPPPPISTSPVGQYRLNQAKPGRPTSYPGSVRPTSYPVAPNPALGGSEPIYPFVDIDLNEKPSATEFIQSNNGPLWVKTSQSEQVFGAKDSSQSFTNNPASFFDSIPSSTATDRSQSFPNHPATFYGSLLPTSSGKDKSQSLTNNPATFFESIPSSGAKDKSKNFEDDPASFFDSLSRSVEERIKSCEDDPIAFFDSLPRTSAALFEPKPATAALFDKPAKDQAIVSKPSFVVKPSSAALFDKPAKDQAIVSKPSVVVKPSSAALFDKPAKDQAIVSKPSVVVKPSTAALFDKPAKDQAIVSKPSVVVTPSTAALFDKPAKDQAIVSKPSVVVTPSTAALFETTAKDQAIVPEPSVVIQPTSATPIESTTKDQVIVPEPSFLESKSIDAELLPTNSSPDQLLASSCTEQDSSSLLSSKDSQDHFEPLVTSSPTPSEEETSASQSTPEPEISLVTSDSLKPELKESLVASDSSSSSSESPASVDQIAKEEGTTDVSLVSSEQSTPELQESSSSTSPASVDHTVKEDIPTSQGSSVALDNSSSSSESLASVYHIAKEDIPEPVVPLVTSIPCTTKLQESSVPLDNSSASSESLASVYHLAKEEASASQSATEADVSYLTSDSSTPEVQESSGSTSSESLGSVDHIAKEDTPTSRSASEFSLVTSVPSLTELQESSVAADNSSLPSEPRASVDRIEPETVDNKPSNVNDTVSVTDKPLTSSLDKKPEEDTMWNNQLSSAFNNSSHEFFDSFGSSSNPSTQQPPTRLDHSSHEIFDSFGLSESASGQHQSRADYTTPSSQATAQLFNSPAQNVQQSEMNTSPFQTTAQALNTSATKLFEPQRYEVTNSQPQKVWDHEETFTNTPGQHFNTQVPYTSAGVENFQNIAKQQPASTYPTQGMNNPPQYFLPQTDTHGYEATNSSAAAEHLQKIEGNPTFANVPKVLNTPSQHFVPQTDTNSFEISASLPREEPRQTQEEQQPLPQTLNTTAHLFGTPQPDTDPFNAFNPSGTAKLFANSQHGNHDDPFESFGADRKDPGRSFEPPQNSAASQRETSGVDASNFYQQEALIGKPSASGSLDQNYRASLPDQSSASGLQANVPPSSSNVHGSNYPFGDDASKASYPPNSFPGSPSPAATTEEVASASNQVTGETLPAKEPDQQMVKTAEQTAVEPPPTFEPVSHSNVTEHAGSPPSFQPPASGLYPPPMASGINQPFDTSSSLYPPGLTSSQPVGQKVSLYPPGMGDLYPGSLQPPSLQMGNTSTYSAGGLFSPDPNLLPPTHPGLPNSGMDHGGLDGPDFAHNQSANATSLQSEGKMSDSAHFTNDPGKQMTSSLQATAMGGNAIASGLTTKDMADNQFVGMNTYNPSMSASIPPAGHEKLPASENTPPFRPVAEPVLSEQSCKTVYDEARVLQDASGIPLQSTSSDYQHTALFQPGPEPALNEKLQSKTAEPSTSYKDAMVTYSGNLPSRNQQIPPQQAVIEPIVMPVLTEAVYAEPGTSAGLQAKGGTLPSVDSHAPPPHGENSSHDGTHLAGKLPSNNQQDLPGFGNQESTSSNLHVGTADPTNASVAQTNVVPQTLGENPHPSAFVPVKSSSPYDERPNLESPLRSPVEREKKEALMPGSVIQTSLWDSEPQLAMPGLIVPTPTRESQFIPTSAATGHANSHGADHPPGSPHHAEVPAQSSIKQTGESPQPTTHSVAKPISGIPGFTQTTYPFTATRVKSSDQSAASITTARPIPLVNAPSTQPEASTPTHQRLQSTSSLRSEGSAQDTTSSLSRQSSFGISGGSQHQTAGQETAYHPQKPSDFIQANERSSSGQTSGHHYPQFAPALGTPTGPPQNTIMHPDASRSAAHTGVPQNEQARVLGGVVPGYGGHDGHVDHPVGSSGGHGSGQSEGMVTPRGHNDGVATQPGYDAADGHFGASGAQGSGQNQGMVTHHAPSVDPQQQQQLLYQQYLEHQQQLQQQHVGQQQQQLAKEQQPSQQFIGHQQPVGHDLQYYQQSQPQLNQQQQLAKEQQSNPQLMGHQQPVGHSHDFQYYQQSQPQLNQQQQLAKEQQSNPQLMGHQQPVGHDQNQRQHQLLHRQTSGQYSQQVNSSGNQHYEQYQTNQHYDDFDSEEEGNRYYDESRKWFWSYKRSKWIRADKSRREPDRYHHDERYYRPGSGRSRYDDDEGRRRDDGSRRRGDRRRDGRHSRGRPEHDEYGGNYYAKHYYDRDYHRRESPSSDTSDDDSQRRGSRSGRSSRASSPRSVSSRNSSRNRRSTRHKRRDYEYDDGYRRDDEYYRSHQSSRSSRRRSSGSYCSSTSNSLSDNIKWDDPPKHRRGSLRSSEYRVEKVATPERLTPKQHNTPHIVGKFAAVSRLSLAPPRQILDGESPEVFVTEVSADSTPNQLQSFPGPLCRGKTHKRDVVKFAKDQALAAFNNQSRSFEEREASYILWQVLALMVQQNGVYLNSDIAEVLTSDLPSSSTEQERSPPSSRRVSFGSEQIISSVGSQQDQLSSYRELLLCGKTHEALEYAISSKMWGHALTLAYRLDQNVFANIMNRFTGNLNEDDSLLCLYQHLSQDRPTALDKKSRRWRKHLAMMIANPSRSPEQDKLNIRALGENLETRGLIEAAHLCYILAGQPIGKEHGIVLLGCTPNDVRPDFVDLLAIQRTELFEYAMTLKDEHFLLKDFQPWKSFYAHSLADAGMHVKAFRYCEKMVENILKYPTFFTENTIARTHSLSLGLIQRDEITPLFNMTEKLQKLLEITQGNQQTSFQYWQAPTEQIPNQTGFEQSGIQEPLAQASTQPNEAQSVAKPEDQTSAPMVPTMFLPSTGPESNTGQEQSYTNNNLANPEESTVHYTDGNQGAMFPQSETTGQSDQYITSYPPELSSQEQVPQPGSYPYGQSDQYNTAYQPELSTQEQVPQPGSFPYGQSEQYNTAYQPELSTQEQVPQPGNYTYGNDPTSDALPPASYSYENVTQAVPSSVEYEETGLPGRNLEFYEGDSFEHLLRKPASGGASVDEAQTTGTSTSDNSFDYYAQSNFRPQNDASSGGKGKKEEQSQADKKEPEKSEKKDDSKKAKQGGGWSLGGFFKSLIPKGKNEMILPDDNKKTIYWDEKEGKWVNTEESEEEKTDLPPPPIDLSLLSGGPPLAPAMPPVSGEASAPGPPIGASFNTSTSSPPVSSAKMPARAPPPMPGSFTPEQPEVALINSPLSTTPSRFSRRAHGSKGRRSNYVDVLSASGMAKKVNEAATPLLLQAFPPSPINPAAVANAFVPDNSLSNTDGTPVPDNSQGNAVDTSTEGQPGNDSTQAPPPPVTFYNPANYATPSPSPSRSRQYPRMK